MSEHPSFDPTADFLSREKAVLGNDAEFILGAAANEPVPAITEPLLQPTGSPSHIALPTSPEPQGTSVRSESPQAPPIEIVSEATRRWQASFNQLLIDRDRIEAEQHEKTLSQARQEIDLFYEEYHKKREAALVESKKRQSEKLQEEVTGAFWEKVVRYLDLEEPKKGNKDVTRFQQLLGQLKYSKDVTVG